jgi:hypothetical protein
LKEAVIWNNIQTSDNKKQGVHIIMEKKFDEIFVAMDQIGIIIPYEEADKMTANMADVFDIPESGISGGTVHHHENTIYRGEKLKTLPGVRMDFFNKFPVELEYLSPVEGDSAWMEFQKKYKKGIHHIRFNVSSHKDAIEYMKSKGIEIYHEADSPRGEGIKFGYFDAYEKLGFYIETINFAEFGLEKA